jgi:hypothetical protein
MYDLKWAYKNYEVIKKFFLSKGLSEEEINPSGFTVEYIIDEDNNTFNLFESDGPHLDRNGSKKKVMVIMTTHFSDLIGKFTLKRVLLSEFIQWDRSRKIDDIY